MSTFGTAKTGYSIAHVNKLMDGGKVEEVKTYIKQHFCKITNPVGVLMYDPIKKKEQYFTNADAKTTFIRKNLICGKFNLQKWFFEEDFDLYEQDVSVSEPKIYEVQGKQYVNTFAGYLYTAQKEVSINTQKKIDFIWKHIYNVWCSQNEELYVYVKNWICNVIHGKKMKSLLYLKSGQGTGKSIITEYLQDKILGRSIVYATSDPNCLLGSFNGQLAGKVLLILEEMPSSSSGQWSSLSNALKHLVTGKTLEIKPKYMANYEVNNCISVMINSNNNAIKIEADDRRILPLDISHEKVGDVAYFNELSEYTEDDEVAEGFFW